MAEKRGGRVAGVPNKYTAELKDMILGALDKRGGVKYLTEQAESNPVAFMGLLGKVLPKNLTVTRTTAAEKIEQMNEEQLIELLASIQEARRSGATDDDSTGPHQTH